MKFFLPLIVSLSFLFESVFVELLPKVYWSSETILVPHFLLVVTIFTAIYGNRKHGLIYGFIFGLLFDIVYTEIIGIHLFLLPFVTYISAWIMKLLQMHIIVVSFVTLIGVVLLELGVYEMNFLIGITDMAFIDYLNIRLRPTLIVNSIFIVIAAYPLKRFMDSYAAKLDG